MTISTAMVVKREIHSMATISGGRESGESFIGRWGGGPPQAVMPFQAASAKRIAIHNTGWRLSISDNFLYVMLDLQSNTIPPESGISRSIDDLCGAPL
jgi:hypothetical protein